MTFLQPFILWGLPLLLLPIIIHLINRLRHRPQQWAAMRFLLTATRTSVSHAKLKQFLILLFRVMAVLMLILFLSRPLAGGWLGWALSPAPDVIILALDRSASMEAKVGAGGPSRREQAIKLLADSGKAFEGNSHLVVIDSATLQPQEIANAGMLQNLPASRPTDTAADIPQVLQTTFNWLVENKAGAAEVWIASDLQKSNWQPEDARWSSLAAQFGSLPQRVQFRLLAFNQPALANTAVSLVELHRKSQTNQAQLNFTIDLQRPSFSTEPAVVTTVLNSVRQQDEVKMEGQSLRWRKSLALPQETPRGWGSFELPADSNPRDNIVYFTYAPEGKPAALVVSSDPQSGRFLQLAAGTFGDEKPLPAKLVGPAEADAADWNAYSSIIWQAPVPTGQVAERLKQFIGEGGTALFLPTGEADGVKFVSLAWADLEQAAADKAYHVEHWSQEEGPLARTEEGLSLPVSTAEFMKRQKISGARFILASFADNTPFLARETLGKGRFYFCASLPRNDWSTLGEGPVLVPMLQRILEQGSARLHSSSMVECGELRGSENISKWRAVGTAGKDPRIEAGVYEVEGKLVAVNRPVAEDDPELLSENDGRRLFGSLPVRMLIEKRTAGDRIQGEIWRIFLFAMLLFLLGESWLILPQTAASARDHGIRAPHQEPKKMEPVA